MNQKSNSANGVHSFDANVGGQLVQFFNRNASTYPTDIGSPSFDLVPINEHKDLMLNVARMQAQQEYQRIMELVAVLQKQAEQIKYRLDLTDMVHSAKYKFLPVVGQSYWLLYDHKDKVTRLSPLGPTNWSCGAPDYYEYLRQVKWLGDFTWIEVKDE